VSRRPATLAVVLASAALVSACGTGLHAVTYQEQGRTDGAATDVGGRDGIAVRDLHVEGPSTGSTLEQGGTALVTGGIASTGQTADTLVGASSDVAAGATLQVDGQTVSSIPVSPQSAVPAGWSVLLTGLTRTVHVAEYVEVTLVFERGGRVTLQVPVRAGDNGLSVRTPEQDPHAEPGAEK
jgi:copper(I)-binding protein